MTGGIQPPLTVAQALERVTRARARAAILVEGWSDAAMRDEAARSGFFACEADLEDELIRAAGTDVVERLLGDEHELASFRRLQRMPEHRGRDLHRQLRRFMGTRAGRKARLGGLMAAALAPDRVPAPLRDVLAHARNETSNSRAAGAENR